MADTGVSFVRCRRCHTVPEKGCVKRCAKCQSAHYCGRDCQVADWPAHKAQCKRWAKAAVEEPHRARNWHASRKWLQANGQLLSSVAGTGLRLGSASGSLAHTHYVHVTTRQPAEGGKGGLAVVDVQVRSLEALEALDSRIAQSLRNAKVEASGQFERAYVLLEVQVPEDSSKNTFAPECLALVAPQQPLLDNEFMAQMLFAGAVERLKGAAPHS